MSEEAFLQSIVADPEGAAATWLVLADWLEEHDDPRAELVRLLHDPNFRPRLSAAKRNQRVQQLLAAGMRPCVPTRTNALGMTFAWCPPGTFRMGSPPDEKERREDETQHRVTLTKGFYLGVTPVTQAQWQAVMGSNPSNCKGKDRPVEMVSWQDCKEFCKRLAARDGQRYRLPTEAEWEYACRAGTTTPFHFGATISTNQANYYDGSSTYDKGKKGEHRKQTTPVGSFPSNAWGLCDLHGNVLEWCQDWYGPYPCKYIKDPFGSTSRYARVLRGGCWFGHPSLCRAAARGRSEPGVRGLNVGCRVVLRLD